MTLIPLALTPLQPGGLLSGSFGQMLVVLAAVAVAILVGRLFLKVTRRLVIIIAIATDALLLLSLFSINVL